MSSTQRGRSWRLHAACTTTAGVDDGWFPDDGHPVEPDVLRTCAGCPVREQCLAYALDTQIGHGVWAGLTAPELANLRNRIREGSDIEEILPAVLRGAAERATSARPVLYRAKTGTATIMERSTAA
jgi:WhiB family redox-sensing transcriptional regulator